MPKNEYIAHVRKNADNTFSVHDLAEHLAGVAKLAGQFAEAFNNYDWGYVAGLWHDLGKYQARFQQRIRVKSGYDPNAHLEDVTKNRPDHSTAGAIYATQQDKRLGCLIAYLIAGHHSGLPDWSTVEAGNSSLKKRLQQQELLEEALASQPPDEILQQAFPQSLSKGGRKGLALWLRLLFSCLVDADFLDTEAFMDEAKTQHRGIYPDLSSLATKFNDYMINKIAQAESTYVNQLRAQILAQCQSQAIKPPGIFSLTVPTGGGKTLSSLAFALIHALKHGQRRIIYVIPYTSIIEQTANIFREIFGESVIEHHSNFDIGQETPQSRLACENWDAPIIVTTSVQFFESLFANRTSRTRKLHNIVNSVVVIDEAQLLPPDFLKPILTVIQQLQTNYGITFVLSTATQPAFQPQQSFDFKFEGLKDVTEIMASPTPRELHGQLKRVELELPKDLNGQIDLNTRITWELLMQQLQAEPTVLCIVDRRDDCQSLFRLMPPGTIHLSGLMCGEHRSKVIADIKAKLRAGIAVRVISTQLVEAGVDLDFPVVYRALAGLDSIAQAAGRCNREGLLASGRVVVFVPPRDAPVGHLRQAQQSGQLILKMVKDDPLSPENFTRYFKDLYWKKGEELDKYKILEYLCKSNPLEIDFFSAAKNFHIIDEDAQLPVIIRYGQSPSLIESLKKYGPNRWLSRRLQRFVVNIPKKVHATLLSQGEIYQDEMSKLFIQAYEGLYNLEVGFLTSDPAYHEPDTLIV